MDNTHSEKAIEEMTTLSDLYRNDCSTDLLLIPYVPGTFRDAPVYDKRFLNELKYPVDDNNEIPEEEDKFMHRNLVTYKVLAVLGDGIHMLSNKYNYPGDNMLQHWADVLYDGKVPHVQWGEFGADMLHLTRHPFEKLPKHLHYVNPDVHSLVTSKAFIGTINCPQAAILEEVKIPCVLKLCHAESGRGVWIIRSEEEYYEHVNRLQGLMPHAQTLITEYVHNMVATYNVYFYVNKSGKYIWIGAVEQITREERHWNGCIYQLDDQKHLKSLFQSCVQPVADALSQEGYFGITNMDIIVDEHNKTYVCDINPRWGASTTAILGLHKMSTKGFRSSNLISGIKAKGPLSRITNVLENLAAGKGLLVAAYGKEDLLCEFVIFGKTKEDREKAKKEAKLKLKY